MVTAVFEIFHHVGFFARRSRNLLTCIFIFAGAWTGVAFFLQFLLTHHGASTKDNWIGFVFLALFVLSFTVYFILVRADELWDCILLLGSAAVALPFALIWDALSTTFLVAQFSLLSASSVLLHAFLVSYFEIYPALLAVKRSARTLRNISVALSSKFVVVRKRKYRSIVSPRGDLCSKCEFLIEGSALLLGTRSGLAWTSETHQHHSFAELLQSSSTCHLCSLLVRSCNSMDGLRTVPQHQPIPIRLWEERSLSGKALLRMLIKSQDLPFQAHPLVIEERLNVKDSQTDRNPQTTDSESVMVWARATIKTCEEDHETCRNYFVPQEQTRFRPTRLLDIMANSVTDIRLIETKSLAPGASVPYLALSHCWGKDGIDFTLAHDKLDDFKAAIRMDRLTKNFQDAVQIARGLGAKYLWIDSLCIIQDSPEDLQQEVESMGLLYANAVCTISATASINSAGGCFRTLEPFLTDCELRRERDRSLVATFPGTYGTAVARLFNDRVETSSQAPLTTRGWTFQERILSSRVLHFCNGVVLFECNTLQSFNFSSEGTPYPTISHVRTDGRLAMSVGPAPRPRPPKPSWPKLKVWPSFSRNYMFTHSTNRVWREGTSTRPITRPKKGFYVNVNSFNYNRDFKPRSYSTSSLYNLRGTYRSYREHALWKPTMPKVYDASARLGMRGAFEMLIKFQGTTQAELLEFHNSWYEIVKTYSVRDLTKPEDKLKALAGIAFLIETNSSFRYTYGLWIGSILSFNLLWMVDGHREERPLRSVPSWSWASVDGLISHRLVPHSSDKGQIQSLIDPPVVGEDGILLLSGCRTFVPSTSNRERESSYRFYPDVPLQNLYGGLLCVPILQLREAHAVPGKSSSQLHGIVLSYKKRTRDSDLYQRVGYFYVGIGREGEQLLRAAARSQKLYIG